MHPRLFYKLFSFCLAFLGMRESISAVQNDVALMPDLFYIYQESVSKFPAPAIAEGISSQELLRWLYFNLHRLELYLKSNSNTENISFLLIIGEAKEKLRVVAQYLDPGVVTNKDNFKASADLINYMKTAFECYSRLWKEIDKFGRDNKKFREIFQIFPIFSQSIIDFCYKRITIDMIYHAKSNMTEPILIEDLQKLLDQLNSQS